MRYRLLLAFGVLLLALPACRTVKVNLAPSAPAVLVRPDSGLTDTAYAFVVASTDPDGDAVSFRFDWGEGDTSDWGEARPSGAPDTTYHTWLWGDTFVVRAQARDSTGALSDWSESCAIAVEGPPPFPCRLVDTIVVARPEEICVLAMTPDDRYLYVACDCRESITVVRTDDNTVVSMVPLGRVCEVEDMAVSADGRFLYAVGENVDGGFIWSIRTADHAVVGVAELPFSASRLALRPDGAFAYVAKYCGDSVAVVRTQDLTVVETIGFQAEVTTLTCSPDGVLLYVATYDPPLLYWVRTADNVVAGQLSGEFDDAYDMVFEPDGGLAYISTGDAVAYFSTLEGCFEPGIQVLTCVDRLDLIPGGYYLLGSSDEDDVVAVMNRQARRVAARLLLEIEGGDWTPIDCAATSDGQRVYAADYCSGMVAVLAMPGTPPRAGRQLPRVRLIRGVDCEGRRR
jgi:dipeptidyl aminopeptidase/acylaminoacyl peptidase